MTAPHSLQQFVNPRKAKTHDKKDDKKKVQMPLFANQKETGRKKVSDGYASLQTKLPMPRHTMYVGA